MKSYQILFSLHGGNCKLNLVDRINVNRCIKSNPYARSFQIHGFADASCEGYGCCIYARTLYDNGRVSSNLLCSKSRVALLKQITLPRLELCGCLLLVRLLQKVTCALNIHVQEILLYSDSMVALHWIRGESSRWKTFVANRVAEIQQSPNNANWHHVKSLENPADVLSRGCHPDNCGSSNCGGMALGRSNSPPQIQHKYSATIRECLSLIHI